MENEVFRNETTAAEILGVVRVMLLRELGTGSIVSSIAMVIGDN